MCSSISSASAICRIQSASPKLSLVSSTRSCNVECLKSINFQGFSGLRHGLLKKLPGAISRSRISMSTSVSAPTVVDDTLFSDYEPTCAFLFPGQ
ncbi:hypothetical protein AMTR_s00142p00001510, partial [Amborella trichopoda]